MEESPVYSIHLPPGLDRAILDVLSHHVSRGHPISRADLCTSLRTYRVSERQLREQIKVLRRSGYLIGSAPGSSGGYYLITTPQEFEDFLRSEYQAKISDMRQTVTAMTKSAAQRWGPESVQLKFF